MFSESEGSKAVLKVWKSFVDSRFEPHTVITGALRCENERINDADVELLALESMIAHARQKRNRAVLAYSLPPEILSVIFMFAREGWSPHGAAEPNVVLDQEGAVSTITFRVKYSLGWMSLLHTCSSWRQVALGTPNLWTFLRCLDVHPQSIPTLLGRSRLLPLSILADGSDTMTYGAEQSISSHDCLFPAILRRTKELVFVNIPRVVLQSWLDELRYLMPNLEKLQLGGSQEPFDNDDESRPVLPVDLFARDTPLNLKSVDLQDIGFSWSDPLFPSSLVTLKLKFIDFPLNDPSVVSSMPTLTEFHQVLSALPALEVLELNEVFPIVSAVDTQSFSITLPLGFRSLTLLASDDFNSVIPCFRLLQHLIFPNTATVTVDLKAAVDHQQETLALFPRLFGPSDATTPRELMLSRHSIGMQYVDRPQDNILEGTIPGSLDQWSSYSMPTGGRALYLSPTSGSDLIHHISSLPLRTLRTITCPMDACLFFNSPARWIDVFDSAKDVQNISIAIDGAFPLLLALIESSESGDFILFPSLRILSLHAASQDDQPSFIQHGKTVALEVTLLDVVQLRRVRGSPLKEVLYAHGVGNPDLWNMVKEFAPVRSLVPPPPGISCTP